MFHIKNTMLFLTFLSFLILFTSCDNTATDYKHHECRNQCSELGIFCDGNNKTTVYNCSQDKNGCFIKEVFENCSDGKTCIDGECRNQNCQSECIAEGYFCENNKRYQCGNFNDDSCLEKKEAFCENDYNCVMGKCVKDCEPSEEICDGIDNDCDGETDEGVKTTFYKDADNDKFGDISNTTEACTVPDGYVENGNDCNDNNPDINPEALEICDGIDNNCNGQTDTDDSSLENAPLADNQDGICNGSKKICSNEWINPDYRILDGFEPDDTSCNGVDNNCNGETDEGFVTTSTSCGIGECISTGHLECHDGQTIDTCTPLPQTEEICDGKDNNCNGDTDEGVETTFYRDADNDGFGDSSNTQKACNIPDGYVENDRDCNDEKNEINPNANEICDGIDNNCNGRTDEGFTDTDGDEIADCIDNCLYTQNPEQIDTDNDNMGNKCDCYPGRNNIAIEEVCNGVDDNCNGKIDEGDVCATDDCTIKKYNHHLYIFCSANSMKKSWEEARNYCNQRNYNLVTIETNNENDWIRDNISNNHWIGLNDLRDGHKWESGLGPVWNTDHDDYNEDCWEIRKNDSKWHDKDCTNTKRFICEKNFNQLPTRKTAAKSCKEILDYAEENNLPHPTGVYYINIGTSGNFKPQLVYCDMDTDGGGWTLVASWYYDYKWTKASDSTAKYLGTATKDTVSSNFGNMTINDFRVVASENIFNNGLVSVDGNTTSITDKAKADWYYHYNTPLKWKEVWAPQAHNGNNENDCSNGYTSSNATSRQSIKEFSYSKNIKFDYINNSHHWNNISDWGLIWSDYTRPETCDKIADYWGALTQDGIEFTVYNNSNEELISVEDGTLGIPIKDNTTVITGHDISTSYNARVGYDDDNANACYGDSQYDSATYNDDNENIYKSTKLWWFIR